MTFAHRHGATTDPDELAHFAEIAPVGMFGTDRDGRCRWVNQQWCELTGLTAAAALGRGWVTAIHPDDLDAVVAALDDAADRPDRVELEYRVRRPDGTVRFVESRAVAVRDRERGVTGYLGTTIDRTERHEAEEALRQSEQRLDTILEQASDIVTILDADGTWRYSSQGGTRLLGYPKGFDPPGGVFSLVDPDDLAAAAAGFERLREQGSGAMEKIDLRVRAADGSVRVFETVGQNLLGVPAVDGIVLHSRDITERRRAIDELRTSNERLATLIAHLGMGILVEDEDGTGAFANEALHDLLSPDLAPDQLLGLDDEARADWARRLFVDPDDVLDRIETLIGGHERCVGDELELLDGRTLERDFVPIVVNGQRRGRLWVFRDVTSLREARRDQERKLAMEREQNRRLLELDRLKNEYVASVSHELRTPLTAIISFARLLQEEVDLEGEEAEFVDIIERNGQRLLRLVGDLLLLARLETGSLPLELGEVDLVEVVADAVADARAAAAERGVSLGLTIDPRPEPGPGAAAGRDPRPEPGPGAAAGRGPGPRIRGDHGRLSQVVENLLSNAIKFTPYGGEVAVTLRHDGDAWNLTVADTGIGIPADEQASLFERFFRASNARYGTVPGSGLGLAISRAIVESHRGAIDVDSGAGEGTTVRVRLPGAPAGEPR